MAFDVIETKPQTVRRVTETGRNASAIACNPEDGKCWHCIIGRREVKGTYLVPNSPDNDELF